jgi:putative drug exporter of the RND superfamily
MERLSRLVLGHQRAVILMWLLVFIAGAFATTQVGGHLQQDISLPGQAGYEANQRLLRDYGVDGNSTPIVPVVTLPAGQTVASPGVRDTLGAAFQAAATATHGRVASYASTGDRRLASPDGRVTYGLLFTYGEGGHMGGGPDQAPAAAAALRAALPPGAKVQITGIEPLSSSGSGRGGATVLTETLVGGLGALAVLAFVFGSLLALVPILIAAVAICTCFLAILGLTEFTGISMIVQYIVALIGLGVAIDYSLLLVTRWREERAHGYAGEEAVRRALATAGRAVVFSGGTVAIGLLAMVVLPVPFLRGIGLGGMLVPLVSVAVVLTLLPVLLARAGNRLDWPHWRQDATAGRRWTAWGRGVVRHRWLAAGVSCLVLAGLALSALGLRIGDAESGSLASKGAAYDALVALEKSGVASGALTPVPVLVRDGDDPGAVAARLAGVPGVATAVDTGQRAAGTTLVVAVPKAEGGSAAGKDTVRRIRAAVPAGSAVGGPAAQSMDFTHSVYGTFPLMLTLVALATFVLLARAFRALLLPLKAVLLNLLSLAAVLGTMVLVWQQGHGSKQIWNIAATGSIAEFIPVLVFAFLFGLSMDYEVFILARMREEYDRTGSTGTAVTEGIGRTGRLVTSAALILFLAFASLASAPDVDLKVFATGLGLGVLLDATVVRSLLVPALVAILGRWNWWLPGWAARLLRVSPSPVVPPAPAPSPAPAGAQSKV